MFEFFNVRLDFATSDHEPFADELLEAFRGCGPVLSITKRGQVVLDVTIEAVDPLDAIQRAQSISRSVVTAPIVAIEVMPTVEFDARIWGADTDRVLPQPWPSAEPDARP